MSLNPKLVDWHSRVVWIVGASSGIGRATAHALHGRGATVVVSARNAAALESFVGEHPGSVALPLDVTDAPALRAAAATLVARHGRLDLALYSAGHYRPQSADAFDLAEMRRHLDVNYVGALHLLDAVLPLMLRAGTGHVSLVASVAGYRGLPQSLAYGPTKAALQHLADTLYLDLHGHGLGVSVVNPGFVATPLTAHNDFPMPALMTPEQAAERIVQGWAAGRFEIEFPRRFTFWLNVLRRVNHALYFAAVRYATRPRARQPQAAR